MKKLFATAIGVGVGAIALYTGVSIYTSKAAEARIDDLIAEVDDTVIIKYERAKVNLLGADLTIRDITVAPVEAPEEAIGIDKIIVREFDEKSDFPTVVDASIQGIQLNPEQAGSAMLAPLLLQAGLNDSLALNLDTRYTYDESSREMTVEEFRLGAEDLGYLKVTFQLGNFDPNASTGEALTLKTAEIVYQDRSFVDNLLASMASQTNQDVKAFKTQLTSGIAQNAQFFVSTDNPIAMMAIEEATEFIENPKGFTISATPQEPLLVSDLAAATDPQAWMNMLNLEIKAHE